MDSAAAHQADNLLTSAAQGGNDGSTLLQPAAGQKLPAGTAKTTSVAADPTKTSLDSNALTQAAALTVIATPLVVPAVAAIPAKMGTAALDAQFSVFTSKPASPGSTDPKTAALASDEDNDNDGETDADSDSVSDKFSADVQDAAPMLVQDNGASDGFGGQNKFSNELTQVLSLVQAGVTQPEKETGRGNATDTTSPATGTDTILSSAGLTLTKQDSGQGLVTIFAPATATAATPQTIYQAPADQVSLTLQRAAASQNSSMTINLNPAELGRVEVNLKFGKNGSVQANVMADKAGTLAMLKGDQTTLQQALQSAGLNPDSSSLSFSLRDDQAQSQQQPDSSASNSQAASAENGAGSDSQAASSTTQYAVQTTGNGHLNLFV
jgi:chemotaxis protein MotD